MDKNDLMRNPFNGFSLVLGTVVLFASFVYGLTILSSCINKSDLQTPPPSIQEVARSMVIIKTIRAPSDLVKAIEPSFEPMGTQGTGVCIKTKGRNAYILTAAHVVASIEGSLEALFFNEPEVTILSEDIKDVESLEILNVDTERDLALIKITANHNLFPMAIMEKRTVSFGQKVVYFGHSYNTGNHSRVAHAGASFLEGMTLIQEFDQGCYPGQSGGPILEWSSMKIAGIISRSFRNQEGHLIYCYGISAEEIRTFLADFL